MTQPSTYTIDALRNSVEALPVSERSAKLGILSALIAYESGRRDALQEIMQLASSTEQPALLEWARSEIARLTY